MDGLSGLQEAVFGITLSDRRVPEIADFKSKTDGPPARKGPKSKPTWGGSPRVIPTVPNGDFFVRLVARRPTEEHRKIGSAFCVSREVLASKCPDLIRGAGGDMATYTLPVITREAAKAMDIILDQLHAPRPKTCPSTRCPGGKACGGATCGGALPIRVLYWVARLARELKLSLPGVSRSMVHGWVHNQFPTGPKDLSEFEDWYLLGPIARYMGIGSLAATVTSEMQNKCLVEPWEEPQTAKWTMGKGRVVFGERCDWPCDDPHLEEQFGLKQRRFSRMKRDALVSALETTLEKMARVQSGDPTSRGTLESWRQVGAQGCGNCREVHRERFQSALREAGIVLGGVDAYRSYYLWFSLDAIASGVHNARGRWLEEVGWGTSEEWCDVFEHLALLGDDLMACCEPSREGVQALMCG